MARSNLFIQRLKRHADTTVLFRRAEVTAQPPVLKTGMPVVQAVVHAGLESLPRGEVIGLPPQPAGALTEAGTSITNASKQAFVPEDPAVTQPQSLSPAPTPAPPIQAKTADPTGADPGWHRLATIMRKHQEKQAGEDSPAIEETPALGGTAVSDPPDISRSNGDEEGEEMSMDGDDPGAVESTPAPDAGAGGVGGAASVGSSALGAGDANIAGDLNVGGAAAIGGSATVGASATVGGPAIIGSSATIGGAANVGSSVNVGGQAEVGGGLSSGTGTKFGAGANIGGDVNATNLESERDATVSGSATAASNVKVGGDSTVGNALTAGSKINAGGDVTAGSNLTAGSSAQAGGDIKVGGQAQIGSMATAAGDMSAGTTMTVGGATVASGDINTGGALSTGAAAGALGDINIVGTASVGAAMGAQGDINVGNTATIGNIARTGGNLNVGGSVSIGGNAEIGGAISAGGGVTIGGSSNVSPGGGSGGTVQRQLDESQAAPLEAVWPVEQLESPPKPTVSPSEAGPILPRHTPENEQIAHALQDVAAERPSSSSVEWVPPRRPRPGNAPTLIQRKPVEAKPSPSEVGHGESVEAATAVPDTGTVPTQIGPLPADLWQLIGQDTPTVMRTPLSEQIASSATEPARSADTQQQTAPDTPSTQTDATSPAPEVEQREDTADTQQTETGSETADTQQTETSSETADESTEPDVDELARRVYDTLKRRLSVEWERMRGKKW